ncbi:FadR/GntR family transcriptional regulator [Faecalicatena contorta]|uniref:FadR/GntR family transcriptional regulator n=1 Tax=Faecalicatena contorta TaxID=39482 RepID=UPI001F2B570C|nr:GntR family transcriptional regulator [Faecalicatena contorta]MCF2555789.1 FadR family transcriptional regulator [Faecalicatena contorta]
MGNNSLFEELPKGSISEIIMQRITDALIGGQLKPGDKIPTEVEFSEKLGVSRNAVREAMKVLVAFGVLEIRRSEGTFVVEEYNNKLLDPLLYGLILSEHSMEELLEVKIAIANSVLYLAILNASDEEIARLREYGLEFKKVMNEVPADIEKMYQASKRFNEYLSEISKNRMLYQLDSIIRKIASFTRHKALEVSVERNQLNALPDNYLKEVNILEARDKKAIAGFMDERLKLWQELLL